MADYNLNVSGPRYPGLVLGWPLKADLEMVYHFAYRRQPEFWMPSDEGEFGLGSRRMIDDMLRQYRCVIIKPGPMSDTVRTRLAHWLWGRMTVVNRQLYVAGRAMNLLSSGYAMADLLAADLGMSMPDDPAIDFMVRVCKAVQGAPGAAEAVEFFKPDQPPRVDEEDEGPHV